MVGSAASIQFVNLIPFIVIDHVVGNISIHSVPAGSSLASSACSAGVVGSSVVGSGVVAVTDSFSVHVFSPIVLA